ncbi:hypothetical protein C8R43DRAFT_1133835 [Mycena crocata]|nr:hypothetical protein C8R43DRAFT_1133835 [Mycena crocata]
MTSNMPPATDSQITNIFMAVRRREPAFPGFKYGFLYGTSATKRRSVAVPINYGVGRLTSENQLFVSVWVPNPALMGNVVDMDVGKFTVTAYPPNSDNTLPFAYSIFYVPPGRSLTGARNTCPHITAGADWVDNILVIKHGKRDAVINVVDEDAMLVDSIVSYVLASNYYPFPIAAFRQRLLYRPKRSAHHSPPAPPYTTLPSSATVFLFRCVHNLSMGGQQQKKRKAVKQHAFDREGRRVRLRREQETRVAHEWFHMRPMFLMEFLYRCELFTIFLLSRTCQYARDMVKAFFFGNLRLLVEEFLYSGTKNCTNVNNFFSVLEISGSAISGSTVSYILTYPYRHAWKPSNLNILVPRGKLPMWHEFFTSIGLTVVEDFNGVGRKHRHTTFNFIIYNSKKKGFPIMLSESRDASVITPLVGALSTFSANLATCSDIYCFYPSLTRQNHALEGWFPTPVRQAMAMYARGVRSSFSSTGWDGPCGWACPALWREVRGLKGVGVFRYGGVDNKHKDSISTVGVPVTDTALKWRIGDTCRNPHCPWTKANYLNFNPNASVDDDVE